MYQYHEEFYALMEEVRAHGYVITDPNQLLRFGKDDRVLLPVLLRYLEQTELDNMKELIVRSLGVKGLTEVVEPLLAEFYRLSDKHVKWTIGNSLYMISDKRSLPTLMQIAQEKKHGTSRRMFVMTLGKLRYKPAIPVLIDLLDDDDVRGHAINALGQFKDPAFLPHFERFLDHKNSWIRQEAKKAIKKIEKALAKQQQVQ